MIALVATLGTTLGGQLLISGTPRPLFNLWFARDPEVAEVLSFVLSEETKTIWVLLGIEGLGHPMFYALPWSRKTAEQLRAGQEGQQAQGGRLVLRDGSDQSETEVQHKPPAPREPKSPKTQRR